MRQLVECVPNFSEGRDAAKVDAIVAAMLHAPGVLLLARESDADHNRSVITLAGDPQSIVEAAVRGVGKAAELIDLTRQTGAHPRLGAADVAPFIPIAGVSLEECVALARQAGRAIWERFGIPVYFYEAAAQRPERARLENIRRGQFEGLREEVLRDPSRAPDVGGPRLHPTAGATVVGARKFLIAYNIFLNTPEVRIAKNIAKAIRFSSGGLRYLKAMGVDMPGRHQAQVSMNLTDFEQTPVHRVFEMVKREAERHGVAIASSELVGLIPRRAMEMAADFYLQMENFSPAKVLENRLEEALEAAARPGPAGFGGMVQPFLDAVAKPTATPGGGSVAALAGALSASVGQMVAGLSRKRKSQAAFSAALEKAGEEFRDASRALAQAMDRDAASFEAVLKARRMPRETGAEQRARENAIQASLAGAAEVPLEVARKALDIWEKLGQLEALSSTSMLSDIRVGRLMAAAAARGAVENALTNLEAITDAQFSGRVRAEAQRLIARVGGAETGGRG